jgi:hypothetical protein
MQAKSDEAHILSPMAQDQYRPRGLLKGERQLVVLDDVLVATDAGRLGRVMGILEKAGQRLQVHILTCHPERHLGLDGAHFFDLDRILSAS